MPKSIILFSDGTGNSSAKLFKTNVWRLYEALDLGPPTDKRDFVQIAYYDNGVGTSQFRPLALLGGIFGLGLKRNILAIYRFLCRNYEPGDRIYCFGFSRGAFTIRLLVGLIAREGVVEYRDEKQLACHARDAFRASRRQQLPNRWLAQQATKGFRWLRDGLVHLKRMAFREPFYRDVVKYPADIDFVGVWDTVAAYGGPSIEIIRGIDDWIWPLTMQNYELSPKVLKARHALAIDDRRDAFTPVLWDEVREAHLIEHGRDVAAGLDENGKPVIERRKVAPDRLEQVWFAGMHADVGGGYPDETLSYVSLAWMMGEADLCLLDLHEERIRSMANAYGPIHNSRAGLGSYYRYQPRKIEAMLDPPTDRDRILRDPALGRDGFGDHGLLTEVRIHKSVVARIEKGTDGYAPVNLPPRFRIVPTEQSEEPKEGSTPAPDGGEVALAAVAASARQADSASLYERPGSDQDWGRVWNLVWGRRIVYFLTVIATLALILVPYWTPNAENLLCEDARCWGRSAFGLLGAFLPEALRSWMAGLLANFSWTLTFGLFIALFWLIGSRLESAIADRTRAILYGRYKSPRWTGLRSARESAGYQYFGFAMKWYVLPFLAAVMVLAFLLFVAIALSSQIRIYFAEQGFWPAQPICRPASAAQLPGGPNLEQGLDLRSMCSDPVVLVQRDASYVVTIRVTSDWKDARYPIQPDGRPGRSTVRDTPADAAATPRMPWWLEGFAPMRRVTIAEYLQPLIAIRPAQGDGKGSRSIFVDRLSPRRDEVRPDVYRAEFTARRSGNLYLFVNDAVQPFSLTQFYDNNSGTACISVAPAGTVPMQLPPPGSDCGSTAKDSASAALVTGPR